MINKSNFSLSADELACSSTALNLFISNEIEGVSFKRKREENILAISTLKKLSSNQADLNLENFRIIAVALFYYQAIINETASASIEMRNDKDTCKYLSIISEILDRIEAILNGIGKSLYSV